MTKPLRSPPNRRPGRRRGALWLWWLPAACAAAAGCQPPAAVTDNKPPTVDYATPVVEGVEDFAVFTGRTQAVNSGDRRSRVTGYLDYVCVGDDANLPPDGKLPDGREVRKIREGGEVKQGDVLFVIEQKPFADALAQAEANLSQQQANARYTEADYQRNKILFDQKSISLDDYQKALAARDTARASVGGAQAAVQLARNNLTWSVITAPFDGRVGRRMVDHGADILADNTVLINIEQTNPLYAYFDVDERTLLKMVGPASPAPSSAGDGRPAPKPLPLLPGGQVTPEMAQDFPLTLGMANERPDQFSHSGRLKFADNRVDPGSGTLRMWGQFDNKAGDLRSGMFIRVRMRLGEPKQAFLVAEKALGQLQTTKYVYVINPKDDGTPPDKLGVIAKIDVEVGQRQDGLIAVSGEGLTEESRVVVSGLQLVRPGKEVTPHALDKMPRAAAAVADKGAGAKAPGAEKAPDAH